MLFLYCQNYQNNLFCFICSAEDLFTLTTGEKYTKSCYENIMIFKEITIMCILKIIKMIFFTKESYCVFH